MILPALTQDLAQAERDIAQFGLCLVEGVLTPAQIERAHTALYRAAAADIAQGREQPRFGLDYGDANQRVWNVLGRDPIFGELVQHPAALRLIRAVIGWPALLGNLSANIVGPGSEESMLHADQIFVPEPWPAAPQGVNVAWCLDEFTRDNGGTRVVPRSHLRSRNPAHDEPDESVPIEAPLGTMMVFESRVWHRTGRNRNVLEPPRGIVRLVHAADLPNAGKLVSCARCVDSGDGVGHVAGTAGVQDRRSGSGLRTFADVNLTRLIAT